MRHRAKRNRLNRFTSWRKATFKSMARNMIIYQSMRTTLKKAKVMQPIVEKMITLARTNDLASRRAAFDLLQDHSLVKTLFTEIGPRFKSRNGGYTRIINLGTRRGDSASMVIFELTEIVKKEIKTTKKSKAKETPEAPAQGEAASEKPRVESKREEKVPSKQKPSKKFLGGIRNIFKKERDSL